jgi:ferredoxin
VHYEGSTLIEEAPKDWSLLKSLRSFKIPVPFSCGGEGVCTTCRVVLIDGFVSKRTGLEQARANERGFNENERLSCQCTPTSDVIEVKIP